MGNSSDAYCLHLFLAFAFKSVLCWIPFFCLFCGLIEHINGTDAAMVWKHTWCTKASFTNSSFYNFAELPRLLVLVNEASQIHNDLQNSEWHGYQLVLCSLSCNFISATLQRREIAEKCKLKYLCRHLWKKWLRIFGKQLS